MKNYISIQEIIEIYTISQRIVDTILKKYKIDCYKGKKGLMINFKDFHKAYSSVYNPGLFSELDKKTKETPKKPEEVEELLKFNDTSSLFTKAFSTPNKKSIVKNNYSNKNLFI